MARRRGGTAVAVRGVHNRLNIDSNHHHCSNCPLLLPTPKNAKCRMMTLYSALALALHHSTLSVAAAPSSQLLIDTNRFCSLHKFTWPSGYVYCSPRWLQVELSQSAAHRRQKKTRMQKCSEMEAEEMMQGPGTSYNLFQNCKHYILPTFIGFY